MFFFDRKQIKKKIACFDLKHGLIPLEKCFFETLNNFLFIDEKVCFFSRTSLNFISTPFLTEKKLKKKISLFTQKYGLTPLQK